MNKNALLPTTQINHLITPESPIKLPNSPHLDGNDLDLSTFDSMTHTNPYYNDNHTFIYTSTNALDLLYETSIDSTIRWKSTRPSKPSTGSAGYALHRIPSQWMKKTSLLDSPSVKKTNSTDSPSVKKMNSTDSLSVKKMNSTDSPSVKKTSLLDSPSVKKTNSTDSPSVKKTNSIRKEMELDLTTPLLDTSLPSIHEHEEYSPKPQETVTIQNRNFLLNSKIEGFTLLQAIQFLLDHDIISTRGEGIDFLSILQDRRIIEPSIILLFLLLF